MAIRKRFRGVSSGGRGCRAEGCGEKVGAGDAYCKGHNGAPEAVAFRRELQAAAGYFDLAVETLDPDQVERAEAFQRFRGWTRRGEFDRLLERPTRAILEQAAALEGFDLEVGALRYGVMRVLAEETDPSRMALALARLSNAVVRARTAAGAAGAAAAGDADVFDRLAAAMMGHDAEGRSFRWSPDGIRTVWRVEQQEERWREAGRLAAAQAARVAAVNAEVDAKEEAWQAEWRAGRLAGRLARGV